LCRVTSDVLARLLFTVSSGRHCHLARDVPEKTGELVRDGDADLVRVQRARAQAPIAVRQAQLGPPGDLAHDFGLVLLADLQNATDARGEAVVLRDLHQRPPRMAVARLGDIPLASGVAGGILRGHQPQKTHQLARMGKAAEVANLGGQGHGGHKINAAQTGQRRHERLHMPVLGLGRQRLGQTLHPLMPLPHRLTIFGKGDVLRGMRKAHPSQVALMGERPGILPAVAMTVP
jgi:hypothetical protein